MRNAAASSGVDAEILVVRGDVSRRLSANFFLFVSGDDRPVNLLAASGVDRMNDVDVLLARGGVGNGGERIRVFQFATATIAII